MNRHSWYPFPDQTGFGIDNLPFGIFSTSRRTTRMGMAVGKEILDLAAAARIGIFEDLDVPPTVFFESTLNDFISLGKAATESVRNFIREQLLEETSALRQHPTLFVNQVNAVMHLPVQVGDFTDFYSSEEHASNVGKMFRDPEQPLLPNWKHLPVAYHGRSSSIVVSNTDIRRPVGQVYSEQQGMPIMQATGQLDFELELGFVIGKNSAFGAPVDISEAHEYIFGAVLVNDWSARDIQRWEYRPLGPFLGKNFATSVSPWVIPMEALKALRTKGPDQEPVLPYLQEAGLRNFDIDLTVLIAPDHGKPHQVCKTNSRYLYWSIAQQIAHHTVNGCPLRVGDLLASGTISGPSPGSFGSLLELSWGGSRSVKVGNTERKFLEDLDTVILKGKGEKNGVTLDFGEVRGKILPARSL